MEYQLARETCPQLETIFEGSREQPVDIELNLPDYCPDIEKILKCRICPCVTAKSLNGDRLEVEGSALLSLYYLDAKKQAIRLCEHSVPFSVSFTVKNYSESCICTVRTKTEYLNCRAVSPRRADIHGAFSVIAAVKCSADTEYSGGIQGDDIEQRSKSITVSRLCGLGQQQFSLTEVLDIGQGKGSPQSILRSDLTVTHDNGKAMNGKLMLSGEARLRLLYVTDLETGAQDTMTFSIPFTQVLDAAGMTESTMNRVSLEVMNYDTALKSEFDENSTLVTFDARLSASVTAMEDRTVTLTEDAYSTEYDLELEEKTYRFTHTAAMINEDITAKEEISTGDAVITRVIDLWCEGVSTVCGFEDNSLKVRGKLELCLLAQDEEETPFYLERSMDFTAAPQVPEGLCEPTAEIDTSITGLTFRITGDNAIDVRADMKLCGTVTENLTVKGISGVSAPDDRCRLKDRSAALTLYYADPGEKLWDIARAYCTSVDAIRSENELADDVVTDRGMLLIPM